MEHSKVSPVPGNQDDGEYYGSKHIHTETDSAEYRAVLNFHKDRVLTAIDIIDSAFYLGIKITPVRVLKVLEELKEKTLTTPSKIEEESTSEDITPTLNSPTGRTIALEGPESKGALIATTSTFHMQPREIQYTIMRNKRLVAKNSIGRVRHMLERAFLSLVGIAWIPAINKRYTPLRHKAEPTNLQDFTATILFIWELLNVCLIKIPAVVILMTHNELVIRRTFVVAFVTGHVTQTCTFIREANWFCKIQRITETYVHQLKHRLNFRRVRKVNGISQTALEFMIELAKVVNEEELLNAIIKRPSLFDIVHTHENPKLARVSVLEREKLNDKRMDKKYGVKSAMSQLVPLSFAVSGIGVFVLGWFLEGGHNLGSSSQTAAVVQLVLASLCLLVYFIIFSQAFVVEALIDFWRHNRLVLFFLHFIGALSESEVSIYGYTLGELPEEMLVHEKMKLVLEKPEDLTSMLAMYEFLREYLHLRTTFHAGFVASLIIVDVGAAVVFLLSTLYQRMNFGALAQSMLFGFAAVSTVAMVVVTIPLTRTSWMVQDAFLHFLLDFQFFLQSEMASPINGEVLSPSNRDNYALMSAQCRTMIEKMNSRTAHVKILGVEATTGNVIKIIGVVSGTLMSGLMRQATNV